MSKMPAENVRSNGETSLFVATPSRSFTVSRDMDGACFGDLLDSTAAAEVISAIELPVNLEGGGPTGEGAPNGSGGGSASIGLFEVIAD